jgi:hypothetical protein
VSEESLCKLDVLNPPPKEWTSIPNILRGSSRKRFRLIPDGNDSSAAAPILSQSDERSFSRDEPLPFEIHLGMRAPEVDGKFRNNSASKARQHVRY